MTETQLEPGHGSASTSWDEAYAALRARFPTASDSVAFAIHTFQTDPSISLDDLKARGVMHRVRITAHALNAAQRLMTGVKAPARKPRAAAPEVPAPTPTPVAMPALETFERPERRPREWRPHVDVADMVQETIAKLQRDGGSEAARLRQALRQALALVQEALG